MYDLRPGAALDLEALAQPTTPGRRIAPGKRSLTMHLPPRPRPVVPAAPLDAGAPLAAPVRRDMEAAFATDFGAVRIHQGEHVRAVGATAFAQGEALHFAPGQYQPDTAAGRELLGHELTHVVQQRAGRAVGAQGKGGVVTDAGLEAEADAVGARVARGEPAGVASARAVAPADGAIQGQFIHDDQPATEVVELITGHASSPEAVDAIANSPVFDVAIEVKQLGDGARGVAGITMAALYDKDNQLIASFKDNGARLSAAAVKAATTMMVRVTINTEIESPTPGDFMPSTPTNQRLAAVHEFERHVLPFYTLFQRILGAQAQAAEDDMQAKLDEFMAELGQEPSAPVERPRVETAEQIATAFNFGSHEAPLQHADPTLAGRTVRAALSAGPVGGAQDELLMRLYLDTVFRGVSLANLRDGYTGAGGDVAAPGWVAFVELATFLVDAWRGSHAAPPRRGQRLVVTEGAYCGQRGVVEELGVTEEAEPEDDFVASLDGEGATELPYNWCLFVP